MRARIPLAAASDEDAKADATSGGGGGTKATTAAVRKKKPSQTQQAKPAEEAPGAGAVAATTAVATAAATIMTTTAVAGTGQSEDRKTKSRSQSISMSKKKRMGDFTDDAPAGCPDAFYLLEGFPASAEHVEVMQDRGIPLGAIVTVMVSPILRKTLGLDTQALRGNRAVTSKQQQRARKRKGGDDKSVANGAPGPADAEVEQPAKVAEALPAFSQLHAELKALQGLESLWPVVNEGDPADPADTAHKVAMKIYELFQLRAQYNAWLKTCNITKPGKLTSSSAGSACVHNSSSIRHYDVLMATLPDDAVSPAAMLSCMQRSEGITQLEVLTAAAT
jgi:hypothetical protein